jgi:hypothetical protein
MNKNMIPNPNKVLCLVHKSGLALRGCGGCNHTGPSEVKGPT